MDDGFRDKIRKIRERNDWSKEKLAEKVGVSLMTIYRWENGEATPRSKVIKLRIAELEASA